MLDNKVIIYDIFDNFPFENRQIAITTDTFAASWRRHQAFPSHLETDYENQFITCY